MKNASWPTSLVRIVCSVGLSTILVTAPSQAHPVPFEPASTVATGVQGASSVVSADLDGDGDLDLISASQFDDTVAWYENDGTPAVGGWTKRIIDAPAAGASSVIAVDVDRDGDIDVLCAARIADDVIWYDNDGTPQGNFSWTKRWLSQNSDGAIAVCAADLDRDGDPDVLAAAFDADQIVLFENNGTSNVMNWTIRTRAGLDGAISIATADVDGDGYLDIVAALANADDVVWFENDGTTLIANWTAHTIDGSFDFAQAVAVADVDGDGDPDVLAAALNANDVVWYENDGSPLDGGWIKQTIDSQFGGAAAVVASDVDGDGDVDAVCAAEGDNEVAWYENDGATPPAWTQHTIDPSVNGASSVLATDLDGDGDMDIVATALNSDRVDWYRNATIHRSAAFPTTEHSIRNLGFTIYSASTGDLDRDGDLDVVSTEYDGHVLQWHENTMGNASAWTTRIIRFEGAFIAHQIVDLDRDGDLDVVSASQATSRIDWHENLGGTPLTWALHSVASGTINDPLSVSVADIGLDGDLDIVAGDGFGTGVFWFENNGATPPVFTQRTIDNSASSVSTVCIADVDGDGDNDVLAGWDGSLGIVWYEYFVSGATVGWNRRTITTNISGLRSVSVSDLDRDGDLDVLATGFYGDEIFWCQSDGNPAGSGTSHWTKRTIATSADGAFSVAVADLDGDGDLDVLSALSNANDVRWYSNDGLTGSSPPAIVWSEHIISSNITAAAIAGAADLDSDGDLDVFATTAGGPPYVGWFENRGGQFALATTSPGQPYILIPSGESDDVLRITTKHGGRAGDGDLELTSFDLLFEESPGDPLTSAEANAVIQNLSIYRDTGSGVFEAGSDALVTTVETLALTAGRQTVTFADGDPNVQIAFGTPRDYFVVPQLTFDALSQVPDTFFVSHVTESSSTAEDRTYDFPLSLEFVENFRSPVVFPTAATAVDDLGPTPGFWVTSATPSVGRVDFAFTLRDAATVKLQLFDLAGREVARLAEGFYPPGSHRAQWTPRGSGSARASGVLFARYQSEAMTITRRVVILR